MSVSLSGYQRLANVQLDSFWKDDFYINGDVPPLKFIAHFNQWRVVSRPLAKEGKDSIKA